MKGVRWGFITYLEGLVSYSQGIRFRSRGRIHAGLRIMIPIRVAATTEVMAVVAEQLQEGPTE